MIDELIGHYRILERIGAGGLGDVYRARDTRLGRTVVIKSVPAAMAADPGRRQRLIADAGACLRLSHPNIAALFEIGEEAERLFLVFEHVPGQSLRAVIAGRPIQARRALDIAIQLSDAIAEAHAAGIVHRDIAPETIIVTPRGHPKLLDCGFASFTRGGAARELAATDMAAARSMALERLPYMSPEQFGRGEVDHRTDVFSLGVVLFEMLTGRTPPSESGGPNVALEIAPASPSETRGVDADVPPALDVILRRMSARDPAKRFQSAATLAAALREIAAGLDRERATRTEASPHDTGPRSRRGARFSLVLVIAGLLATAGWAGRHQARLAWHRVFGPQLRPVIGVVPLDWSGDDRGETYFADGLTEDLTTRLAQIPGLAVTGRRSARVFRGRPPQHLARELDVPIVLIGTLASTPDQVTVGLELLDTQTGASVWTGRYTTPIRDILGMETAASEEIARALRLTVPSTAARARTAARTVDPAAYDLYLRGRDAAAHRDTASAAALLEQAVAVDPAFAEAQAALAIAIYESAQSRGAFTVEMLERMRQAASDAAAADPDLPQAQRALGLSDPGLVDGLSHLRRAIELDPSNSDAYREIGEQVRAIDPHVAMRFQTRAVHLDPLWHSARLSLASTYAWLDRFDEARRAIEKVAARGASDERSSVLELILDLDQRQYATAIALNGRMATTEPAARVLAAAALSHADQAGKALEMAAAVSRDVPDNCEAHAMVAALRFDAGDRRAAHQIADPLIEQSLRAGSKLVDGRCGLLAAAAVNEADRAAALVRRVAADGEALKFWVSGGGLADAGHWLRRQWYPLDKIATRPEMIDARSALDQVIATIGGEARRVLDGLLGEGTGKSGRAQ